MAPHGMLDERPPALRPGAPAFFWQALQVAGLTELGLGSGGGLRQVASLLYCLLVLLVLLVQIGLLVAHWTEVLPAHVATAVFLAVVAGWVNLALFLQTGHLHRLLAASAFSLAVLPASSTRGARSRLSPAPAGAAGFSSRPVRPTATRSPQRSSAAGGRAGGGYGGGH